MQLDFLHPDIHSLHLLCVLLRVGSPDIRLYIDYVFHALNPYHI